MNEGKGISRINKTAPGKAGGTAIEAGGIFLYSALHYGFSAKDKAI